MIVSGKSVFDKQMASLTYYSIMVIVSIVRCLPLTVVARLGRFFGRIAYSLDKRHRIRTYENLRMVFGDEWSDEKVRATAKENFLRLGENYASAIKAAYMTDEQLRPYVEVRGAAYLADPVGSPQLKTRVIAIGHFGNFELYARLGKFAGFSNGATTYRALKNPGANRVMEELRERSDLTYFERRKDVDALKLRLREGGMALGILSDHHAGGGGIPSDFLGHACSATPAPVVLAMRYKADLYSAVVYRTSLAHWLIDIGPQIPLRNEKRLRAVGDVTQEIQNLLGEAVRRDPANWFWVHNRWRPVRPASPVSGEETGNKKSSKKPTGA
jgi:lauroyl/myristoyl acyltransferase